MKIKQILSYLFTFISAVLLAFVVSMVMTLMKHGEKAKVYKNDYAILHSVAYGMFNSDVWATKMANIIDKRVESFDLNADNREDVKGYINTIIDTLVLEAERVVRERNKGKSTFFGSIFSSTKQMITDSIINFKDLRRRVPEFTDAVMLEVEKSENQERAKRVVREKIKAFMREEYKETTDMSAYNAVIKKYNAKNLEECSCILDKKRTEVSEKMDSLMVSILSVVAMIVLLIIFSGTLTSIALLVLTGSTASLLISGIFLPMLDIEAKVSQLYFVILEQKLIFENQILFFQTKSISDLVHLLIESGKDRMILVGVLLTLFSIMFPTLKLFSTYLYFYSKSIIGNNPITRFFVLKSTKWSMADVMVVSIFMAYLGLDGVVSNELKKLEGEDMPVNIITTNGTHLEVGFFLFLGFVFCSFVLSILVAKKVENDKKLAMEKVALDKIPKKVPKKSPNKKRTKSRKK